MVDAGRVPGQASCEVAVGSASKQTLALTVVVEVVRSSTGGQKSLGARSRSCGFPLFQ